MCDITNMVALFFARMYSNPFRLPQQSVTPGRYTRVYPSISLILPTYCICISGYFHLIAMTSTGLSLPHLAIELAMSD